MKKFFQRIDQSKGDSTHSSSFVGKTFVVGKHSVTVEDTIAEGGFALVFLVKGNGGVKYALKRMYVNTEQDLQVAWNEINIAKALNGPRTVVGFIDSSVNPTGNGVYEVLLLMNYYKKHLLHLMNDKINTGLSEVEVLRIFCDVCDAVSRLHHSNPPIIHRDLKVENILINSDNGFLLCDFGSATQQVLKGSIDGISNIEDEIQKYTTLSYRAPEMVDLYLDKPINHKADIWALGCLLYKLCFFALPFGESPLAITSGNFSIPDNCKYSKYLQDLIRYMLEPDPNQRPDIYQVSSIAFKLANLECPIPNLYNSPTPSLDQLSQLIKEKEQQISIKISRLPAAPVIETTSVAPRQRPKGSQSTGVIGVPGVRALPLPVQNAPGKRSALGPSPDVITQEDHQQELPLPPPAVVAAEEPAAEAVPFPPSALFGSDTFPSKSFGSPDSQQNLETEAMKLFPPAGYGDPFQEDNTGHDSSNPEYEGTFPTQGLGYHDQGLSYPDQGLGYHDQGHSHPDQGLGYHDQGPGYQDQGLGYPDQHSNLADQGPPSGTFQLAVVNSGTKEPASDASQGHHHTHNKMHRRNVSDSSAFDKTFASETALFLAPFDSSLSITRSEEPNHESLLPESSSESQLNQKIDSSSVSWNPFNDWQPFSQMSEDHIFGAEFDKIRKASHSGSDNSVQVKEDDPFGSAPFSYSGRRSKSVSKQSDRTVKSSASEALVISIPASPTTQQPKVDSDLLCKENLVEESHIDDVPEETFLQQFVRPPLEDRSKYEKLQDVHDEESDDENHESDKPSSKLPYAIKYLQTKRSKHKSKNQECTNQNFPHSSVSKPEAEDTCTGGETVFQDEIPPPLLVGKNTKNPSAGVFECNVSEDDSIGSASDLKDRINEECDYYYCDRGTIGSSVYHAECESVTTHEEEGARIEAEAKIDVGNVDVKPSIRPHRGPKPSRGVLRARAKALKDLENKKIIEDRLLGHECGEKPLLQDDELDSDEEEKDIVKDSTTSGSMKQHFSVPKSYSKLSSDDNMQTEVQEDVFASAPFKNMKDEPEFSFQASQPCNSSVSPLDIIATGIVSPPAGFKSPEKRPSKSPESKESIDVARIPLQSDVIFEESPSEDYPIYENVTLNEGKPLSSEILRPDEQMMKRSNALLNKNPFLNPFLNENVAKSPDIDDCPDFISSSLMSSSLIETPMSTLIPNSELSQIFESTPSLSYAGGQSSSVPLMPTDIFGSTIFSNMRNSTSSNHAYGDLPSEPMPDLLRSTEGAVLQAKLHHRNMAPTFPPNQSNYYIPLNSTPIKGIAHYGSTGLDPPPTLPKRSNARDEDLFGAVPFKVDGQERAVSAAKSQTLPANISSSIMQSLNQMVKDEDQSFKVPNVDKCTPPGFRKSRLSHQVLTESDSSSEEDSLVISTRKPKIRDKSKDRLKYRNIGDEFEDENVMVLPNKQFKKEKDKVLKKAKKHDKHDKKFEKRLEKHEKRVDKCDKTDKKVDKLKEKVEKRNQESAGISNMSFEDYSLDDARRLELEALALQSPEEEDSDLRTTGGNRFGSLKRGMNPFTKLGR